ncbi:ATP-dependent deoxyribonuclease subunit B [Lactococcus lactis]|uniref:ATP-dependent deoxyribonuclease subunit B n=1 Tax=Lactococcus lactis TaxID=1358 RepID=UPI0025A04B6B|nr:ATP-dependent deoxyribonuclease subunit B [Lactococcus lactis]MDM7510873.1 ATP-dependent deoxyribonuclease subunit B [Lactococcus lactis]
MIRPNVEYFQKRILRVPNNVRMLQYKMSGYEFNLKKFEQGVYDQLFFYIPNETEALGLLNEIGLMFPPDSMTRKKYYSLYQEKRIADLPEGYKMAIYFLIDNDLAQATL